MLAIMIRSCLVLPAPQPLESSGATCAHLNTQPAPASRADVLGMDPIELAPFDLRKPSWACTRG